MESIGLHGTTIEYKIMSEEFVIQLGPRMSIDEREQLRELMTGLSGVTNAHYIDQDKLNLMVVYTPEITSAKIISDAVRNWNLYAI